MVSAIYNGVIIAIYITGSLCALFTILKNISAKDILIAQDASRKNSILSNLNQVLFAGESKQCDFNLLMELDDNVSTARNQRLSFIMSCSNVSTLVGLLGTFAGLSITIGSIGNLLSSPSDVGGDNASNTLNMIVTMVASLSETIERDEYRICIFYLWCCLRHTPDLTKCFCSQLLFPCFYGNQKIKKS
ncbi:membrane protein [Salmonella enterica subsp. enterica]|uniref:Membrane protein n=1 Tax=Salmonella enterica I TaxID=59201 RepID=A0A3S4HT88_SALET|nr:membrane protein [Salmonella enterica subsp. enterica]